MTYYSAAEATCTTDGNAEYWYCAGCNSYFEDETYAVDEAEATAFDRQFPPKELVEDTPTQLRFKELCAMQKDYINQKQLER